MDTDCTGLGSSAVDDECGCSSSWEASQNGASSEEEIADLDFFEEVLGKIDSLFFIHLYVFAPEEGILGRVDLKFEVHMSEQRVEIFEVGDSVCVASFWHLHIISMIP